MRVDLVARKIMMKMKGWTAEDRLSDLVDHPREHAAELAWLIRQLNGLAPRSRAKHGKKPRSRNGQKK